jgi:hypothetical protein
LGPNLLPAPVSCSILRRYNRSLGLSPHCRKRG